MASLLADYWAALGAFGLFALLHSIGAQEPFKNALARCTSPFFVEHFWRLFYCALSFGALYWGVASLLWARHPENDIWLIVYPDWLWQAITVLHLGSIVLLYVAFLQSDYLEFLGLKQAARGVRVLLGMPVQPAALEFFGTHRLVVTGVYGWVRHPMLAAGLLFLLTSGPSLNNLIYTAIYAAYMLVGAHYEERRLVRIFGEDYLRYRARVGAFFPRLRPAV
ncbi:MAG TPA: isoprenylcysteine carboxylmethyltransferase family protein [Burkholderiales bacterium]|nr:isoprenylcysteine carboxylmethyltransferase family protein [Burkholderiales bacterium]